MKIRLLAAVSAGLLLAGCGSGTSTVEPSTTDERDCITSFDAGTDYFPDKSTLKHAKNFSVRYEKSYQVLTVNEPTPGAKPESSVLVRCGAPDPQLPGELSSAPKVHVPIRTLYSASTTHLPLLVDLGNADPKTTLVIGTMTQGVWYVASGGSYVGKLIADAGGSYPWENDPKTGSLQLSFETVFAEAPAAPIWLVIQPIWNSKADALTGDPRYGELTAMRSGQVWSANKVLGPGGGNDYYERGVTRPDLVLADLVAILHPDLLPDHEFTFYQRLTDR